MIDNLFKIKTGRLGPSQLTLIRASTYKRFSKPYSDFVLFLQVLIPPGNIKERLREKTDDPFKVNTRGTLGRYTYSKLRGTS